MGDADLPTAVGDGRFCRGQLIGSGVFGAVYSGTDTHTGKEVALKFEPVDARRPQVMWEAEVYAALAGGTGVPNVYMHGQEGEHNVLVMDLLGPSLEDLLECCGGKLSLKTVLMLAEQLILRLQHVHEHGIVHRDIKPGNFLMGKGDNKHVVNVIDFGFSQRYRDPATLRHAPYVDGKKFTGTARFASVNTHLGIVQSRRDDLEALGYMLMYLSRGSLPWQGLGIEEGDKSRKYERIMDMKMDTDVSVLCKSEPPELVAHLKYCRSLGYEDEPDYKYLLRLWKSALARKTSLKEGDFKFDWMVCHETRQTYGTKRKREEGEAVAIVHLPRKSA
jgi:casein kinase 1 epsilon